MKTTGLKTGFLSCCVALTANAVLAADLQVQTSGLPDDSEAVITVVNEATGASVSLGLDATSKVRVKDLVEGAVTVKAEPVEYQGMTFTPTTPETFMLLQPDYPDVYLRLKDYVVRHPTLATPIENNLFGHTVTYTTSTPPSTARLFAGLDRGILWNCDTTIPNSCGDFDNAGSKQDMTHLAYGSGYVWASLLNTGGVDDSLLWKCDANTLNACATWDLWPKSQVTVSDIAVSNGRVYVSWWESGAITGSTGIKSCDANASQPDCSDLVLNTSNGDKVLDVVVSGDQVYYLQSQNATAYNDLIVCPAAGGHCEEVVFSVLGRPLIEDQRWMSIRSMTQGSNGLIYTSSANDFVIQQQPSGSAFNELDSVIADCAPNCRRGPDAIAAGNGYVYIVARDVVNATTISACSFVDGTCHQLPNWGVSGQGDINAITAGGGKVYLGYSAGKMLICDESTPDQACASFNTAGDAINDMVYVADPLQ